MCTGRRIEKILTFMNSFKLTKNSFRVPNSLTIIGNSKGLWKKRDLIDWEYL